MQHEVGSIVEGKVTGITKFGAFVELEGGSVGMVHISEISQSYVNDINDYLKEQQIVKVKILNIGDDGKISLSIKRTLPPPQHSQQGGSSHRREGGGRPPQAGGRPPRTGGGNGGNRGFSSRGPAPSKDNSFEDMLSKFMKSSDEKFSDTKQPERRRGSRQKRGSYDYD
ncbi:MAG: S1 RNA-binding domain-containing protein [Oscillospiraceae bacterium]|jgi:S1 RNA binding domain protein|nr:S1 RNA-binding domain-containing protein [Oscillospiraceae bacterium]